jgi:hypothetical protein
MWLGRFWVSRAGVAQITQPSKRSADPASPGGAGRNKTLNRSDFLKSSVHVPSLHEQKCIAEILSNLDPRASLLSRYFEQLSAQRDSLAALLLAGRIPVPGAAGGLVKSRGGNPCPPASRRPTQYRGHPPLRPRAAAFSVPRSCDAHNRRQEAQGRFGQPLEPAEATARMGG